MSENSLFIMFILIAVIPFILGGMTRLNEIQNEPAKPYKDYRITIEPVVVIPKAIHNFTKNINNEAKDILVAMGFTATEAKKLINEVGPCNSTDEIVQAALMRVQI